MLVLEKVVKTASVLEDPRSSCRLSAAKHLDNARPVQEFETEYEQEHEQVQEVARKRSPVI